MAARLKRSISKATLLVALPLIAAVAVAWGAGSATIGNIGGENVHVFRIVWTSDAAGDVSGFSLDADGRLERVTFLPAAGASQPSALYDVTLTDVEGYDVLGGNGANRINNAVQSFGTTESTTTLPMTLFGPVNFNVSNAGNAKSGTLVLYVNKN